MKSNAYFQTMKQICTEFDRAREMRRTEKLKCHDAAELDAWHKREKEIKFPFTSGQMVAYHAWYDSICSQSSTFEVQDLPWENNVHDFVEALRDAGITEFAVTDHSTSLMRVLHELAAEGCAMQELCRVTRLESRWSGTETIECDGILFRT